MTVSAALLLLFPISLVVSTALVALTTSSLRATLEHSSDGDLSVAYWVPYSVIMIYLVPLFVTLVFGVATMPGSGVEPEAGYIRIFAGVLGGSILVLVVIGSKLSKHLQSVMRLRQLQAPKRSMMS